MSSVIKIKRSDTAGSVPGSLQLGEIAVNLFDRKLYVGNTSGVTAIGGEDFRLTTMDSGSEGAYLRLKGDSILSTNNVLLSAGEGIDITRLANGTVTFAGEDASASNKGVAKFSSANFTVTSGDVALSTDISIAGQLDVGENAEISGNTNVGGTLGVTGASTLSSTLTVTGQANFNGGINVDTGTMTIGNDTGNISTSGTLTVTGATALNGGLTMDTNKFIVADTTGNVTTAGTLTVAGATTLSSTLAVDGTSSLNDVSAVDVSANGNLSVTGTSTLTGNVTAQGDLRVNGDTTIDGNLTVEGALTYISTSTVYADDGMFKLAANNAGDTVDTGIYGKYIDGVTSKFAGYFRDASDGVFKFYKESESEPTTTVDTSATGYALAQVDAVIDGGTY